MNARLAAMFHVEPHIEKMMRGNGFEQKRRQFTAEARAHSAHGERHDAHVSLSLKQIQFERAVVLRCYGIHFEMNENRPQPVRIQQWLGPDAEDATLRSETNPGSRGGVFSNRFSMAKWFKAIHRMSWCRDGEFCLAEQK